MKFLRISEVSMDSTGETPGKTYVLHVADNRIDFLLEALRSAALSMPGVQFAEVTSPTSITPLKKPAG
jgi:hypothetical protein